jgi:hypothetical protein
MIIFWPASRYANDKAAKQPLLWEDAIRRIRRRCIGRIGRPPQIWPVVGTACADCGVGTHTLREWYMVHDTVWDEAWRDRRKWWHAINGQQVLCIGCLEQRLGRTLTAADFNGAPCNDPNKPCISARLRDRLTATQSVSLRRQRGRPKGSKNKRKIPRPT